MKILHTADWHLGQKFLYNDREAEHRLALSWLTDVIKSEEIELLIVAGDIFDIGNPPNYARSLYYKFLIGLQSSTCRHIIIVGGNHDSPAMLNAPKDVLKALNIHVIGAAAEDMEDQIILLNDSDGQIEAVVAAVPFLRDRDLRSSIAGESIDDRIEKIKQGIFNHYKKLGDLVKPYKKQDIPIITTGHLFAKGATASDKQDNIYIGNMENINADEFPSVFNYVALGHLHKAQSVGQQYHIRYSGSIIPLSFAETADQKSVSIIEFEGNRMKSGVREINIPLFRKLITFSGSLEKVQQKLQTFSKSIDDDELTAWVEVIIETDEIIPNLDGLLKQYTADWNLDLLKIRTNRQHFALEAISGDVELDELDPMDVFQKKCESYGSPPKEMKLLTQTFKELQNWMQNQEEA